MPVRVNLSMLKYYIQDEMGYASRSDVGEIVDEKKADKADKWRGGVHKMHQKSGAQKNL